MSDLMMKADGLSRKKIEHVAQKILKDFCPDLLESFNRLDIERMFEHYIPKRLGIETAYEELSLGIHGYTDPINLRSVVSVTLVDSKDLSTLRYGRSTIGHEIGHAVLHAYQFKKKKAQAKFLHDDTTAHNFMFRTEDIKIYEHPEFQAWELCKSLFMPKPVVEAAVENGMTIKEMSRIIDLNPAFVESRLRNLKLLDKVRAF